MEFDYRNSATKDLKLSVCKSGFETVARTLTNTRLWLYPFLPLFVFV